MLRRTVVCLALILSSSLLWTGVTGAQGAPPYPETPPTQVTTTTLAVSPTSAVNPPSGVTTTIVAVLTDRGTPPPLVAGQAAPRGGSLPVTGGDLLGLAALGAGAMVLGGAVLLQRRRLR